MEELKIVFNPHVFYYSSDNDARKLAQFTWLNEFKRATAACRTKDEYHTIMTLATQFLIPCGAKFMYKGKIDRAALSLYYEENIKSQSDKKRYRKKNIDLQRY